MLENSEIERPIPTPGSDNLSETDFISGFLVPLQYQALVRNTQSQAPLELPSEHLSIKETPGCFLAKADLEVFMVSQEGRAGRKCKSRKVDPMITFLSGP